MVDFRNQHAHNAFYAARFIAADNTRPVVVVLDFSPRGGLLEMAFFVGADKRVYFLRVFNINNFGPFVSP